MLWTTSKAQAHTSIVEGGSQLLDLLVRKLLAVLERPLAEPVEQWALQKMDPLRNLSASEGESTRWSGSALLKFKRYPSKTSRLVLPVDSADGVVRKVGQTPRRKLKLKGGDQPSRLEANDFKFLRRQLIGGGYTTIPLRLCRRIRCTGGLLSS